MIIESIKIANFGLYKGENFIQLSPYVLGNKNITVLSGQNGVGKSTLLEAIHLCLLGTLSIDNRLSEANYEKYLIKRSYAGKDTFRQISNIELVVEFIKSGAVVRYKICRCWMNDPNNVDEDIMIEENGKSLDELSKKEKNLFLRELIQPGLAKVMFFDGEKLLSLYDENNLIGFIAESCRYLFGLNFVDLLNTDLGYYINKLYSQQDASQFVSEINKIADELKKINTEIISLEDEKSQVSEQLNGLRSASVQAEKEISDHGRWAAATLDSLKGEKQQVEVQIVNLKKELIEAYSSLGPFVFCKGLLVSLRDRLEAERDINKWQHARDLMGKKIAELELSFQKSLFLDELGIDASTIKKLFPNLKRYLLSTPVLFDDREAIYHDIADSERERLLGWIDEVVSKFSELLNTKSSALDEAEERSKSLNREQSSFTKDDILSPLLKEIQEINKQIGANEQKLSSLNRRADEANKRKEFYSARMLSLEARMQTDVNVDEKLRLSSRTKQVLESYRYRLLSKKLILLQERVLCKFNLLCRKESYLDRLSIDPKSFEIELSRNHIRVDHGLLSAGEKQILILSFLWGLRELTNIALPLIIDTPLARLDLEHRKAFIEQFLPAITPQVILIGTDMELNDDMVDRMQTHISHRYLLQYDQELQATQITEIEPLLDKEVVNEN